jgi:hypothetical protein
MQLGFASCGAVKVPKGFSPLTKFLLRHDVHLTLSVGANLKINTALTFFHLLHIDIPYTLETNPNAVYVATMRSLKHPQK